jgi:hypothetical protein
VIALYAIARGPIEGPLGRGVQKEPLRAIPISGVAVVAGEVHAAPPVSPKALAAHDRVVRRATTVSPAVLPMRFGSVAPNLAVLRRFARRHRSEIVSTLAKVEGCEQFTLRVFVTRRRGVKGGPGARWLRARSALPPEIAPLREAVAPVLKDERAEAEHGVISVYHLVARADRRAYRAALARGLRALTGARVVVSGPWPVYAFAEAE